MFNKYIYYIIKGHQLPRKKPQHQKKERKKTTTKVGYGTTTEKQTSGGNNLASWSKIIGTCVIVSYLLLEGTGFVW